MKSMRSLSLLLLIYWSGGVSALPLTYDFGFNGSVRDFSGAGFFTVSELIGAPGLDAFSFAGTCSGFACEFGLGDLVAQAWNFDPDGSINSLDFQAFSSDSNRIFGLLVNPADLGGFCQGVMCIDTYIASYAERGAFLELRDEEPPPPEVPVPTTLLLVGAGLAGLRLFRRQPTPQS